MKLKAVLTTLDGLAEPLKALYAENEHGEFVLDLDGVDAHPTVRGLKTAHETRGTTITKLKKQLEAYGEHTPEEIQTLLEKIEELEGSGGAGGKGKGGGDAAAQALKDLQTKLETKHAKELEKLTTRNTVLQKALEARVIDGELDSAIEGRFRPELKAAVRAMLKQRGPQMVETEDGKFAGVFKADLNNVPGDHSITDFVKEWAKTEDAAAFIPPSGRTGSGADGKPPRQGGGKFVTEADIEGGNFSIEDLAAGKVEVVG